MSRRECAELLAAVDAGLLAVTDVVRSAASGAEAAGDLHVSELLAAAGVREYKAVMRRARHTHGGAFDPTLRWVVDPRSHGRRVSAYADALARRPATWPGFPFTPAPQEWRQ
jgi:hypothetical protein